jgi:hypothetical protein
VKAVTWVEGGPGAFERARAAAFEVAPFLLANTPNASGAVHVSVDHDPGCPGRVAHDITKCTCALVEIVTTPLTVIDRALLETVGDYEHVQDPGDDDTPGFARRVRWPAGGD